VADTIRRALQFVPRNHLRVSTNCGMAPMRRDIALAKLQALGAGAALAREEYARRGRRRARTLRSVRAGRRRTR